MPPNKTTAPQRLTITNHESRISFLILIIALSPLAAFAENQTKWPKTLKNTSTPAITIPTNETPPFTYETKTFRFITDQKISPDKMRAFALTAESVPAAISRIPLPLRRLPVNKDGSKPAIYLFADPEDFIRAGAAKAAAGYYSGKKQAVFIRSDQFINIQNGRTPNYNLLVHELTHLCNHGILGYVPAWFSEGNAEYLSAAFIPKGSYRFDDFIRRIPAHAKKFTDTSETITLPNIDKFLATSSKDWTKNPTDPAYTNYLAALILTHYTYHLNPDGRKDTKKFITHLLAKKNLTSANEILFPSKQRKTLTKNLETYWKKRGLKINFQK